MKAERVYHAQGGEPFVLRGLGPIPDTTLNLGWEKQAMYDFKKEAERVVAVLKQLPGGTFDQVLVQLMQERASLFVVPLFEEVIDEN